MGEQKIFYHLAFYNLPLIPSLLRWGSSDAVYRNWGDRKKQYITIKISDAACTKRYAKQRGSEMIKAVLFDWGNTLMIDFHDQTGPMHRWKKIEAVKNAEACLSKLSEEFPCYIATNAKDSTKEDINKALTLVNIRKYITDVFCYNEMGHEKPTRDFFKSIFKKLSLAPHEIVLIGDDIEKDFNGARRNGIYGILFDPDDKNAGAELRIKDLLEIHNVIDSLTHRVVNTER
jgi:putative hydrolase of the HAD superfamily